MKNSSLNAGSFIVLIKDFSAQLIFIKNINLNTLTLKLIQSEPLLHQYRNIDISHLQAMTGCESRLVYQTNSVGTADKQAVLIMMLGMMD